MESATSGPRGATGLLIRLAAVLWLALPGSRAADDWSPTLAQMPVSPDTLPWTPHSTMAALLHSWRTNPVARAVVFLPSVADELLLFGRAAPFELRPANVLEAVAALTNRTAVRVTFRAPYLLLHTDRDAVTGAVTWKSKEFPRRFRARRSADWWPCVDWHWERVQPELERRLNFPVRPSPRSETAWHFGRHYFVAGALDGVELLEVVALAGGTRVEISSRRATFSRR